MLGPYRIERELARGGMGVVYVAEHVGLQRRVALKLLKAGAAAGSEERRRFEIEARSTASLDHPNIVRILEVGEVEWGMFFAMELVEGPTLKDKVRQGPLPVQEAARLLERLADALAYSHAHGVLHRDIKPANVLVASDGRPVLTDFGLARDAEASGLTKTGQIMGTPAYMSPEQAEGVPELIDRKSDIYSLGATLYELLTGQPPFTGSAHEQLAALVTRIPQRPSRLRPELDLDLETITLKCLEKQPHERYATAKELAEDLERYLDDRPIRARPPSTGERLRRWSRRNRPAVVALVSVGVAVYLLGMVGFVHYARTQAEVAAKERLAESRGEARVKSGLAGEARAGAEAARARLEALAQDAEQLAPSEAAARRQQRLMSALELVVAAQRWLDLDAESAEARQLRHDAALALGGAAEAAEQWVLAQQVYEGAAELEVDPAAAQRALEAMQAARAAAASERVEEVRRALDAAAKGPQLPDDLLLTLVRYPEQPVVDVLVDRLGRITRELKDVVREAFLSARLPDAAEAASGQQPLEGLAEAVERYLERSADQPLEPDDQRVLAAAGKRYVLRGGAGLRPGQSTVDFSVVLGRRIGQSVPPLRLQLAGAICEALGWIGIEAGAAEALQAYLRAEHDGRRAIPAGRALLRVGGARGLRLVELARSRFGPDSAFSEAMGEAMGLATATVEVAEGSPGDLARRGQQRMEQGRLEEALRDYDQAARLAQDERMKLAVVNGRAEVLVRLGRMEEALRDATTVIELASDSWKGYANRGGMYGRLGEHERSKADFDQAIALGGAEHYGLYEGRAMARRALGDSSGAADDMRAALRLQGGVEGCRDARLLTVFAQVVPPAEALPAAQRAVELEPRRVPSWQVLTTTLRALQRHEDALRAVERALEVRPGDIELRAERALALVQAGRGPEAQRLLAELLAGEARLPLAYRARALLRFEQREVEGALADLDQALRLAPGDIDARWYRGQFRLEAGDLAGAEQDLNGVAAARPELAQVKELLAKVRAAREGKGDPALRTTGGDAAAQEQALEAALRERPDDPRVLANLGILRRDQGDLAEGLRLLDKALELDPSLAAAWSSRGQLKARQGRLREALADLDQALKLEPKLAKLWVTRAGILLDAGELQRASADLDQALELDPTLYFAWISRASLRVKRRDVPGAIRDLTRATQVEPGRGMAYARRAELRRQTGDPRGAVADLDRAIECRRRAIWFDARGALRRELGDVGGALLDAVEATKVRPDIAAFWANRGNAEGQLGRNDKAELSFAKALELDPELALAYYGRGYTRFRAGNYQGAVDDLDECLKRRQQLEAHGLRGLALAKLGRRTQAKQALEAFLTNAPQGHAMRVEAERALGALGD